MPALNTDVRLYASQFMKHMRALMLKRYHYFKRDLKGLVFLVLIPIAVICIIIAMFEV